MSKIIDKLSAVTRKDIEPIISRPWKEIAVVLNIAEAHETTVRKFFHKQKWFQDMLCESGHPKKPSARLLKRQKTSLSDSESQPWDLSPDFGLDQEFEEFPAIDWITLYASAQDNGSVTDFSAQDNSNDSASVEVNVEDFVDSLFARQ